MRVPAKTVLCATDLTPTGDGAVGLAYALAAPGAVVHLLFVNEPAFVLSPLDATVVLAAPNAPERQEGVRVRATRHMEGLVPADAAKRGVRTEVHVIHDAAPAAVIEQEAERRRADLMVLGTHGRGGIAKALLGSVATSVMRRAKVPVVLFRDPTAKE